KIEINQISVSLYQLCGLFAMGKKQIFVESPIQKGTIAAEVLYLQARDAIKCNLWLLHSCRDALFAVFKDKYAGIFSFLKIARSQSCRQQYFFAAVFFKYVTVIGFANRTEYLKFS